MVETSQIVKKKDDSDSLDGSSQQSQQSPNQSQTSDTSIANYDNKKAATNVSLYLSLTALSSLVSSYFGGFLMDYLKVR